MTYIGLVQRLEDDPEVEIVFDSLEDRNHLLDCISEYVPIGFDYKDSCYNHMLHIYYVRDLDAIHASSYQKHDCSWDFKTLDLTSPQFDASSIEDLERFLM